MLMRGLVLLQAGEQGGAGEEPRADATAADGHH